MFNGRSAESTSPLMNRKYRGNSSSADSNDQDFSGVQPQTALVSLKEQIIGGFRGYKYSA